MQEQRANISLVAKAFLFAIVGAVGCQQFEKQNDGATQNYQPSTPVIPVPSPVSAAPSTQVLTPSVSAGGEVSGAVPVVSEPEPPATGYFRSVVQLPISCAGLKADNALVLFAFGQSISSNANEKLYPQHEHVYTLRNGECIAAEDPLPIADGKSGSMWMPLAGKIIDAGLAKNVLLVSIGVGGTPIERWVPTGDLSQHLESNLELLNKLKIPVSMFLWHQGTSNIGISSELYQQYFLDMAKTIRNKGFTSPILIAKHSRCFGSYDKTLEAAQNSLAQRHQDGLFLGANTNLLDESYRFDTCHLNANGQEQAAQLWFNAITETDELLALLKFGL